jgi:predicted SnoaL-like aldol condensation-catalyzing enzyme
VRRKALFVSAFSAPFLVLASRYKGLKEPIRIAAAIAMVVSLCTPLTAQSHDQLEQNKKLVLEFWREVLESCHVELASKYLAPGYIQHNPNVETGLDEFVKFFSRFQPQPIQSTLKNSPIYAVANGDRIILVFAHEATDPHDSSKKYKYNSFDMFRVAGGKIQEHWDSALKQ